MWSYLPWSYCYVSAGKKLKSRNLCLGKNFRIERLEKLLKCCLCFICWKVRKMSGLDLRSKNIRNWCKDKNLLLQTWVLAVMLNVYHKIQEEYLGCIMVSKLVLLNLLRLCREFDTHWMLPSLDLVPHHIYA